MNKKQGIPIAIGMKFEFRNTYTNNEFVLINLPQEAYTITVYNSSGQITELQQSNGQAKISVNTSSYAEGLYLIRVQGIKTQQDYKVSIKH